MINATVFKIFTENQSLTKQLQIKLQREKIFFENCDNGCIIIMNLQDGFFLYCINLNQCAYKAHPCSMGHFYKE